MSQVVGQTYKSRIPTLGDDASIQEALRVYHYGVDNYSTQPIPNDSIEGNFRGLDTRISAVEGTISTALAAYVRRQSSSSSPNIITGQSTTTIPIAVRAIANQTVSLQQWQASDESGVASMSTGGALSLKAYLSVGTNSLSPSSSVAISVNIINPSNKGIVVRSAPSQTSNLQEWQNSAGTSNLAWVSADGSISTSANATISNDLTVNGDIILNGSNIENNFLSPLMLIGS